MPRKHVWSDWTAAHIMLMTDRWGGCTRHHCFSLIPQKTQLTWDSNASGRSSANKSFSNQLTDDTRNILPDVIVQRLEVKESNVLLWINLFGWWQKKKKEQLKESFSTIQILWKRTQLTEGVVVKHGCIITFVFPLPHDKRHHVDQWTTRSQSGRASSLGWWLSTGCNLFRSNQDPASLNWIRTKNNPFQFSPFWSFS